MVITRINASTFDGGGISATSIWGARGGMGINRTPIAGGSMAGSGCMSALAIVIVVTVGRILVRAPMKSAVGGAVFSSGLGLS